MEVYYGHNFWYHKKEGKPLKKFSVHKAEEPLLKWGESEFFIPALYVGSEGVSFFRGFCCRDASGWTQA